MDWIYSLKEKVPKFLENMKGVFVPGFFKYSLTGDIYKEEKRWGLGNTVFAVKIYYTLGVLDNIPKEEKQSMSAFIKNFQGENGTIYDPLVKRKAYFQEKAEAVKSLDLNNFFHKQIIRAETRQAFSALDLLADMSDVLYRQFPKTEKEIEIYLNKLNWEKPWGAGSHFSHLLFFLKHSDLKDKEELIDFAIAWVNKLQDKNDGSWYKGNPSRVQKVNAAMKILTGLKAADLSSEALAQEGKMSFKYPGQLIDLCLDAENNRQACDNFNIIYVLHYANKILRGEYRSEEIKEAARKRLEIYRQYYFPEHGGFSFSPNRANKYYYGAKITRGLPEPDIHGTCLFLWGISIIAQILGIDKKLGFKEHSA